MASYSSNESGDFEENESSDLDIKGYLLALRRGWWLILVLTLLGAAAAWLYLRYSPEIYAARILLVVEQGDERIVNIQEVQTTDLRTIEALNTLLASITSSGVIQRVANTLQLENDPRFAKPTTDGVPMDRGRAIGELYQTLSVSWIPNTRLIQVEARHTDAGMARDIVDTTAKEFIRHLLEQRLESNNLANQFLVEEAARLRENVRRAEEAVQNYREEHDAISLDGTQDIFTARLRDVNARHTAVVSERRALEADFERAAEADGDPGLLMELGSVASSATVAFLRQAIADKESEIVLLSQRYRPKHPNYRAAQTQLDDLNARLEIAAADAAQKLGSILTDARQQEESLATALRELELEALSLNRKAIDFNDLVRTLETEKSLYTSVLGRLKETDITKGLERSPVGIHEPASASGRPVAPDPVKAWAGGIAGGLVFGIALLVGLHAMDRSVKTLDQAEAATGLPVLATVPLSKGKTASDSVLQAHCQPHEATAEGFRTLRASLNLVGEDSEERRVVLFTSALPGEGKTFSSANYAVVLAQQGLKTLIIDADLRKPMVSPTFFGSHKKPGLVEYLAGRAQLDDVVHPSEVENLDVLPAGERAPNPAELLAREGFGPLIRTALERYERVIVDSAPILAVSDTLLLTPHIQSTCLVIRSGKTARKLVQRACKVLREGRARVGGIVFNAVPADVAGYYYYYSSRGYGSKGVYGAPSKR